MTLDSLKFSKRRLRDAARLALQGSAAAALLFCAMEALGLPEKLLAVISAVFVLDPGLGGTLFSAFKRFAATIIGASIGAISAYYMPDGYGTALAIALSLLVMNAIVGLFPMWRFGVVAAAALAINGDGDLVQGSTDRIIAAGLGVIFGSAASLLIWPQTSKNRADEFLTDAMRVARDLLGLSLADAGKDKSKSSNEEIGKLKDRFASLMSGAREAMENVRMSDDSSLHRRIDSVESFYNSLLTVIKIAENEEKVDQGDGSFDEAVQDIKKSLRDVLEQLIDDPEKISEKTFGKLYPKVELARNLTASDTDEENWHHTHRVALTYSLNNIVEELSNLNEPRTA